MGGRLHPEWRYATRLLLHAACRRVLGPRMRAGCRIDEPPCARNFAVRGYRHHTRGLDLPSCCRARLLQVLDEVTARLDDAGVRWFAYWGTFLGAVRHGDLIPWDRDVDLIVRESDRAAALAALRPLEHRRRGAACRHLALDYGGEPEVLRVQASALNTIGVDVEFWREGEVAWTHRERAGTVALPVEMLFPQRDRPLAHRTVPTPASTRALLVHYGPTCLTLGHRREQRFGDPWVPIPATARPAREVASAMSVRREVATSSRRG